MYCASNTADANGPFVQTVDFNIVGSLLLVNPRSVGDVVEYK